MTLDNHIPSKQLNSVWLSLTAAALLGGTSVAGIIAAMEMFLSMGKADTQHCLNSPGRSHRLALECWKARSNCLSIALKEEAGIFL